MPLWGKRGASKDKPINLRLVIERVEAEARTGGPFAVRWVKGKQKGVTATGAGAGGVYVFAGEVLEFTTSLKAGKKKPVAFSVQEAAEGADGGIKLTAVAEFVLDISALYHERLVHRTVPFAGAGHFVEQQAYPSRAAAPLPAVGSDEEEEEVVLRSEGIALHLQASVVSEAESGDDCMTESSVADDSPQTTHEELGPCALSSSQVSSLQHALGPEGTSSMSHADNLQQQVQGPAAMSAGQMSGLEQAVPEGTMSLACSADNGTFIGTVNNSFAPQPVEDGSTVQLAQLEDVLPPSWPPPGYPDSPKSVSDLLPGSPAGQQPKLVCTPPPPEKLFITALGAEGLGVSNPDGQSDPCAVFRVPGHADQSTPVARNTRAPEWHHVMEYAVPPAGVALEVLVYGNGRCSADDALGSGVLHITPEVLLSALQVAADINVPLTTPSGAAAGLVRLKVSGRPGPQQAPQVPGPEPVAADSFSQNLKASRSQDLTVANASQPMLPWPPPGYPHSPKSLQDLTGSGSGDQLDPTPSPPAQRVSLGAEKPEAAQSSISLPLVPSLSSVHTDGVEPQPTGKKLEGHAAGVVYQCVGVPDPMRRSPPPESSRSNEVPYCLSQTMDSHVPISPLSPHDGPSHSHAWAGQPGVYGRQTAALLQEVEAETRATLPVPEALEKVATAQRQRTPTASPPGVSTVPVGWHHASDAAPPDAGLETSNAVPTLHDTHGSVTTGCEDSSIREDSVIERVEAGPLEVQAPRATILTGVPNHRRRGVALHAQDSVAAPPQDDREECVSQESSAQPDKLSLGAHRPSWREFKAATAGLPGPPSGSPLRSTSYAHFGASSLFAARPPHTRAGGRAPQSTAPDGSIGLVPRRRWRT